MRAMANGALSRFNPAQPGAQGMKVVATGLLFAMAAVFAVARAFEHLYPGLSYVKAFAEAAMVGGLIFSTLLTLLLVPSYFSIAISIESRVGRLFHRVVGSDAHQAGRPVPAE